MKIVLRAGAGAQPTHPLLGSVCGQELRLHEMLLGVGIQPLMMEDSLSLSLSPGNKKRRFSHSLLADSNEQKGGLV